MTSRWSSSRRSGPAASLWRLGSWGLLLSAVLGAGSTGACITLDPGIACGDGYVDLEAGEECDPGDPSSFVNACVGTNRPDGIAACDPMSCTIINDLEQCAVCGDGRVDESLGEQCDGDELNGRTCPGGVGILQCDTSCRFDTSECGNCGNGVLEEGEECDPNLENLTMGKPSCADLSAPTSQPYTSGTPIKCREDCLWDRTACGYCGNGKVDREVALDFEGNTNIAEWCDGGEFHNDTLNQELSSNACTNTSADLRPIVECSDDCLDFIPVELPQPCCLRSGALCPNEVSPVRCCFEIDNPNSALDPCQSVYNTETQLPVFACR